MTKQEILNKWKPISDNLNYTGSKMQELAEMQIYSFVHIIILFLIMIM